MCVAAVAWHAHPRWQLVAIGNRDELHERASAPLARWKDTDILAGRDLVGGGTWLGVSETGRFALITNRRGFGDPDPAKRSRGELATALLRGDDIPAPLRSYNAFNVLATGPDDLEYLTNRPEPLRAPLGHGVYGLSNGALDEPWPKTLALKAAVTDWLAAGQADPEPLFAALRDETLPPLGVPPAHMSEQTYEPRDTPPFIRHPLYGTRCSTVVTVDFEGRGTIVERRFSAAGEDSGETRIGLVWTRCA